MMGGPTSGGVFWASPLTTCAWRVGPKHRCAAMQCKVRAFCNHHRPIKRILPALVWSGLPQGSGWPADLHRKGQLCRGGCLDWTTRLQNWKGDRRGRA
jgi:hypothetical protein